MTESAGPGAAFEIYALNEQLVDKLKLLDYEKELVGKMDGMKIVPRQVRHYFTDEGTKGERFFVFTTLCMNEKNRFEQISVIGTWLMRKAQWKDVNLPTEMDDPNTTIGLILDALRSKDLDANYATQKLKSGDAKSCINLLSVLVEEVFKVNKFEFQRIVPVESQQPNEEQDQQVDEAELTFDEEDAPAAEDEDDVAMAEIQEGNHVEIQDDLFQVTSLNEQTMSQIQEPLQAIMHTNVEANSLRNEIDRILPQLRLTIRASDKMHDEQLTKLQESSRSQFETVQPFLLQMNSEIGTSIERIQSREKHLNEQLAPQLQEYRLARNAEASGGLEERQETLQRLSDEIVQIKQQIDEQGAQNSNGAPIAKITQAIAKLEQSILTMSVQSAAIEQSIHQNQLNDRAASSYYHTLN
ncbi:Intraflagellar transport protein che-13 [Aphelenchoides besseyi]|nr:Intraflagellar transport protein che-13 [Aphelenchoides besseyi]